MTVVVIVSVAVVMDEEDDEHWHLQCDDNDDDSYVLLSVRMSNRPGPKQNCLVPSGWCLDLVLL